MVSVEAHGSIVVNGGKIPISGGVPTVANTVRIVLQGRAGDDQLVLDPLGGTLPGARIVGGPGADVLVGGSGNDEFAWGRRGTVWTRSTARAAPTSCSSRGATTPRRSTSPRTAARVLFLRNVDNVTTDLDDVETIEFLARGGADSVVVGDLNGTDVTQVRLDLRGERRRGRRPGGHGSR